jgi:hypothetical protein
LYSVLEEQAKWLIKREENASRIYRSNTLFQTLRCFEVIEISTTEDCGILSCDKIFRTQDKVPVCWEDSNGYIIKDVSSIDNSVSFTDISPISWPSIVKHPNYKYVKTYYFYQKDGYLYFPERAPKAINVFLYAKRDVSHMGSCGKPKVCVSFMDEKFRIPDWIEAELFNKALIQLASITSRLQDDNQIDKNTLRKGQG